MRRAIVSSLAVLAVAVTAASLRAASTFEQSRYLNDADWCKDVGESRNEERFCEVRELSMAAPSIFDVTTGNGAIAIEASSRRDLRIRVALLCGSTLRPFFRITVRADRRFCVRRLRTSGFRLCGGAQEQATYYPSVFAVHFARSRQKAL